MALLNWFMPPILSSILYIYYFPSQFCTHFYTSIIFLSQFYTCFYTFITFLTFMKCCENQFTKWGKMSRNWFIELIVWRKK